MDLRLLSGDRCHFLAAEESELSLRVYARYALHEPGSVQIAAHLTGYYHIFHIFTTYYFEPADVYPV